MGLGILILRGEEKGSATNKGWPWTSKFGLEQPPRFMENEGFQAFSRGDFDPLEEVYHGLNMVESETNNKGDVKRGFLLELKNASLEKNWIITTCLMQLFLSHATIFLSHATKINCMTQV